MILLAEFGANAYKFTPCINQEVKFGFGIGIGNGIGLGIGIGIGIGICIGTF